METINDVPPRLRDDAAAIQRIRAAGDAEYSAKQSRMTEAIAAAKEELCATVQAANDGGVSWQTIGDALGLRRGAAYQRFRRDPRLGGSDPHRSRAVDDRAVPVAQFNGTRAEGG